MQVIDWLIDSKGLADYHLEWSLDSSLALGKNFLSEQ